jgi:hypothetical protein
VMDFAIAFTSVADAYTNIILSYTCLKAIILITRSHQEGIASTPPAASPSWCAALPQSPGEVSLFETTPLAPFVAACPIRPTPCKTAPPAGRAAIRLQLRSLNKALPLVSKIESTLLTAHIRLPAAGQCPAAVLASVSGAAFPRGRRPTAIWATLFRTAHFPNWGS